MPYVRRVVDTELDELAAALPALALEGPRGVGKTASATRRAASVFHLDDPAQREVVAADPAAALGAPAPVLLDEWQRVPAVWDAVRRAVDADRSPGRYWLTGSASPVAPPSHSGAGRIVTVRMRPLALSERALGAPTVSLRALLSGERPAVTGRSTLRLADYAREIVASGFPAIHTLSGRPLRAQLDSYLARIAERDFNEQGHAVRRPEVLRRWMTAYAAATATTTSLEKIRTAAAAGDGTVPAKTTTLAYRDVLHALWIIDPIAGWLPSRNHFARLTQAPKHHLADPALAARLLGVGAEALLSGTPDGALAVRDGTLFGNLFESLVAQSVRVYAQAVEAQVRHLRVHDGRHEIDLIVERPDQRVVAIETKLSATVTDDDVKHLLWLRDTWGTGVLDLVVVTTGTHAYRRPDGVAVVPAGLLGP